MATLLHAITLWILAIACDIVTSEGPVSIINEHWLPPTLAKEPAVPQAAVVRSGSVEASRGRFESSTENSRVQSVRGQKKFFSQPSKPEQRGPVGAIVPRQLHGPVQHTYPGSTQQAKYARYPQEAYPAQGKQAVQQQNHQGYQQQYQTSPLNHQPLQSVNAGPTYQQQYPVYQSQPPLSMYYRQTYQPPTYTQQQAYQNAQQVPLYRSTQPTNQQAASQAPQVPHQQAYQQFYPATQQMYGSQYQQYQPNRLNQQLHVYTSNPQPVGTGYHQTPNGQFQAASGRGSSTEQVILPDANSDYVRRLTHEDGGHRDIDTGLKELINAMQVAGLETDVTDHDVPDIVRKHALADEAREMDNMRKLVEKYGVENIRWEGIDPKELGFA